jgi:catechol 2,3-dioxygenase-like lactoylglutathione lyase family enzyme
MTVTGLRQVAQRIENLDRAVHFYEEVLGARMAFFRDSEGNLVGLSSRRAP